MDITNFKNKAGFIFSLIGFLELLIVLVAVIFFREDMILYLTIFEMIYPVLLFSAWIFGLIGLVLGIKSLKSPDNKYAKIGIALSVLGLLEYVLFYYILVGIFGLAG
jgi:hypothetical protein